MKFKVTKTSDLGQSEETLDIATLEELMDFASQYSIGLHDDSLDGGVILRKNGIECSLEIYDEYRE